MHPAGTYAYTVNLSGNAFISQYKIVDGKLTPNGTVARTSITDGSVDSSGAAVRKDPGGQPVSIAVDPSGSYADVANTGSATGHGIFRFSVGIDGKLTSQGRVAEGLDPRSVSIAQSGKYVYVVNTGDDTVSQFSVGANGNLAPLGSIKVVGKAKPAGMTNHPVHIATTKGPAPMPTPTPTPAPTNAWVQGAWKMSDPVGISGLISINSDLNVISGATATVDNCAARTSPSAISSSSSALTCTGPFSSKTWKVSPPDKTASLWLCEGSGTWSGKNVNYVYPSTDGKTCDVTSTFGTGSSNDKINPGTYDTASLKLWYVTHWYGIFKVSGSFSWKATSPDQATFTGRWVSTNPKAPTVSGAMNGTVQKATLKGTFNWDDAHEGIVHTTGVFTKM